MVPFKIDGELTGREYRRVSLDRSGDAKSTGEQGEDNLADAEEVGARLLEPYCDDSRSASRYATRVRDDFERLMQDLRAGEFGAKVLWLWESSRGSRKVGEWVEMIDLCDRHEILIRVTTHKRFYDPQNARDRRSLLEDAVDSEFESSKMAARARRSAASLAAKGRPHGNVPYGYVRRYDERTRLLVAQELDPIEAPVVEDLFDLAAKGRSIRSIARAFAELGIKNRSGKPFKSEALRSMLLNPAYAGLRVYVPGVKYGYRNQAPGSQAKAKTIKAMWPAIVPEKTFYLVKNKITAPDRKKVRPGRANHLLSMIARCGVCDRVLAVRYRNERRVYMCHGKGCCTVTADEVDKIAEKAMIGYLSRDDVYDGLVQREGQEDSERAELQDEIEGIRGELSELSIQLGEGRITATLAGESESRILERLQKAERRMVDLSRPEVLRGLIGPNDDVAQRWKDIPLSARREVSRALLCEDILGALVVMPSAGSRSRSAEDRVKFRRPDSTES